jgi:hypothetical protein
MDRYGALNKSPTWNDSEDGKMEELPSQNISASSSSRIRLDEIFNHFQNVLFNKTSSLLK